ncbi:choline dehydrogenase [Apiospora hydei]|uniref:Choline dehydrogenase n=1 Tax=Apiospora hydei TaxID=1337664 RepID=A0ABR1WSC4_9PEZI
MWPFSSYPEHSPSDVHGKTYDYIIVGGKYSITQLSSRLVELTDALGGTAGCVIASRLSEDPDVSVLVIDKGHVRDNVVSRMPLLSQNMFLGDVLQVQGDRWSEPITGANGRRNRLWAVEGIGGASRMNAMLWTRGYPGDYAAWSELGLTDWNYEKLEPYFRRMENAVAHPDSKARGHEGDLPNFEECMGDINPGLLILHSQDPWKCDKFRSHSYGPSTVQKLGLQSGKDINDPAAPAMGFFDLDVVIDKRGNRVSALSAYLNKVTAQKRRDRLTICTGAVIFRLEADAQTGTITGVHIRSAKSTHSGEFFVKARREVVLCAGAACTPQLLPLSGIGPAASSESLGTPLVKALPAVGATLFDHYSMPIMLEVPKKETFHLLESVWGLWHILIWLFSGKGFLGLGSMSNTVYLRSDAIDEETMQVKDHDDGGHDRLGASLSRNVPDIEVMFMPNSAVEREVPGRTLMSLYPTLVQPQGSGRVELASKDVLDQPRIIYPMFNNEHDIATARMAVRFAMRLAEELQNSDYPYPAKLLFAPGQDPTALEEWEKAAPAEYVPVAGQHATLSREQDASVRLERGMSKTWKTVTDDEIDDYMRRVSHTSLHFSGTCPMAVDERRGVVDQQLRVYGFSNLRIADTSVFPKIPSCHTMAPVMAMAKRCAEFVKSTWNGKKSQ